jgi:hypothetical protein
MVAWWKRLAFSFFSMLAAICVCAVCMIVCVGGLNLESLDAIPRGLLFFLPFFLLEAIPVWLLSIPLVLLVKNLRTWHLWMWWGTGSAIGPVALSAAATIFSGHNSNRTASSSLDIVWNRGAGIALGVSSLTTLGFILLLRWEQARTARKTACTPNG